MQEVADFAGVSRATVSRVLADSQLVSAKKRNLVFDAVKKLGYKPYKNTKTAVSIGVYVLEDQMRDPFFSNILEGIQGSRSKFRIGLQLEHPKVNSMNYSLPIVKGAEGIILLGDLPLPDSEYAKLKKLEIPVVVINGIVDCEEFSYINIEERKAMIQVIQTLVELGHARIAFIAGPDHDLAKQERLRAYKLGLLCAHLPVNKQLIITATQCDAVSGYEATIKLLQAQTPTAILTANDQLAVGVYQAVAEFGLKIPDDISVVGFNDLAVAKTLDPPLSSIAVPLASIGKWAVSLLVAQVLDPPLSQVRLSVPTELVARKSLSNAK